MNKISIYDEILHNISSGSMASLPAEKLAQFSVALARPQAYTHFGASAFPQICDTVRTLLATRSNEETLSKIPHPTTGPSTNSANEIHNPRFKISLLRIAEGVFIAVLAIIFIWVLNHYLGLGLWH